MNIKETCLPTAFVEWLTVQTQTTLPTLIHLPKYFARNIFLLSTIHWILVQYLSQMCTPLSLKGLIFNFMTMGSPMCVAANRIQSTILENYGIMWGGITILNFVAQAQRGAKPTSRVGNVKK